MAVNRPGAPRRLVSPDIPEELLLAHDAPRILGEGGEEPRLAWWRTELASEFGGEDLFQRLLPNTWAWAVLQGAREAARRRDAAARSRDHDPDRLLSLFRLGFELDERIEERLLDLKRTGRPPAEVLPGLKDVLAEEWNADVFTEWVSAHRAVNAVTDPAGRRLRGDAPESLELLVEHLVGALAPLGGEYPLPHYRKKA